MVVNELLAFTSRDRIVISIDRGSERRVLVRVDGVIRPPGPTDEDLLRLHLLDAMALELTWAGDVVEFVMDPAAEITDR
jgi:hypothetical protein